MRTIVVTFIFSLGVIVSSIGQAAESASQNTSQKNKGKIVAYKAWVSTVNGNEMKGLLFYADEQEVVITNGFKSKRKKELINIPFESIELINLQRQGVKTEGAIVGALIGIGLALLITNDVGDSSTYFFGEIAREAIVLGYVVTFATEGAIIGAKLSDEKVQFYFNGNELAYKNQLNRLKDYCLVREQPEIITEKNQHKTDVRWE